MGKFLGVATAISLAVVSATVAAQDKSVINPDELLYLQGGVFITGKQADLSTGKAADWEKLDSKSSWDDVTKQLKSSGWNEDYVRAMLPPGHNYDLYRQTPAPGTTNYLAVPIDGAAGAKPVTFVAPGLGFVYGKGIDVIAGEDAEKTTVDEIKKVMFDKMMAAIDGVCAMGKRKPKTVTLTIDAFSFLVAEATWETAEACAP
jgi:hypothetical protein